jgi:hypothetical protein
MGVVATNFVRKGDELTVAYVNGDIDRRRTVIQKHGFTCDCYLCTVERSHDVFQFRVLEENFDNEIRPRIRRMDTSAIPFVQAHIQALRNVYGKCRQSSFLFKAFDPLCGLALLYDTNRETKNSVEALEEAFLVYSNIQDVDAYVEKRLTGSNTYDANCIIGEHLRLTVHLIIRFSKKIRDEKRVERWRKMLLLLEWYRGNDRNRARQINAHMS